MFHYYVTLHYYVTVEDREMNDGSEERPYMMEKRLEKLVETSSGDYCNACVGGENSDSNDYDSVSEDL